MPGTLHSAPGTPSAFSLAVSRLSDQTKLLAQRLALLEERVESGEEEEAGSAAPADVVGYADR